MDLDRPVFGRFRLEHVLYASILLVALGTRLWGLGDRPLHHDESIHAYYSWRILEEGVGDYDYDPVYHGPVLYYGTAVFQALFGASDFSSRLFPVACSLALVALAWPLRPLIGRREALVFALLMTFSPTLGYYGRSLRHDVPLAAFTFGAVLGFLHYLRSGTRRFLYLAAASIGLAAATKEDIYLTAFTLANSLWILALWSGPKGRRVSARARSWLAEIVGFLRGHWRALLAAVLIAVSVALFFYTSLLERPRNWNPVGRALSYWWGQHTTERIGGEWWYYLPLELLYEPILFLPAVLTLVAWLFEAPVDRTRAFFATWAVLTTAIYAWAQEKVPWLLVPALVPQAVLASAWLGRRSLRHLAAWAPAMALSLVGLVSASYVHDAPRPGQPEDRAHHEPLVYVQTTWDLPGVLEEIERVSRALGTGRRTPVVVTGSATWPLSWYLRGRSVHWGPMPRETNAAILVVDPPEGKRLLEELGDDFVGRRFSVRGWWIVDWSRFSITNLLRFLVYRVAWNAPGTTDAMLLRVRDLTPRTIAPRRITPPAPTLSYPGTPAPGEIVRVIGGPGTAPGRFREPRGLAAAADGTLYVADSKNHRIQKIALDGTVLRVWGGPEPGDGPGELHDPMGVAVGPDGTVFVADTWNHRIQAFSSDGALLREWRAANPGFWGPRSVAVSPGGTVFVADTGNKRVLAYRPDGTLLHELGGEGTDDGEMIEPVGVAIDPDGGRLLVADTGNRRIQAFDLEGRFLGKWRVIGWQEFYTEPYLAWTGAHMVTTDSFAHRVNVYTPEGTLARSFGGSENGWNRPTGVAVAPDGALVVSDTHNHRIVVLSPP